MRTSTKKREEGEGAVVLLPANEASEKLKLTDYTRLEPFSVHTYMYMDVCVCVYVHASHEKLGTGLDNDPRVPKRQRQQTQIPPSCGSR